MFCCCVPAVLPWVKGQIFKRLPATDFQKGEIYLFPKHDPYQGIALVFVA
jgi:hypothetical protein